MNSIQQLEDAVVKNASHVKNGHDCLGRKYHD